MTTNSCNLFLIFLIFSLIFSGCNEKSEIGKNNGSHAQTIRVQTANVIRDSIPLPLFIPGKLATAAEMKLSFKTGGIIRELSAPEGANLKKGTRIAALDTIELAAWRNKAQTAVEKASRDLIRAEQLHKDDVATLEQLQNARSAFAAARSDLAIATFNLSNAVLKAPSKGKILKRLAEKNEVIGAGMPVIIFASTDGRWLVKSSIPDRDLPLITIGDSASVTFDALPQQTFSAHLSRIAGAAHPVTGTFEIELSLTRRDIRFKPGLIADVRLFPGKQKPLTFIPAVSLVNGNGSIGTVYTVNEKDSIIPLQVTIERLYGDHIAVSEGLEDIPIVIAAGAPYVHYTAGNIIVERNRE